MDISQTCGDAVIAAALAEASAIGVPMNVAVLDAGAHLKAFVRMDGALLGSIDIALTKARTAALFGMNTEAVGEFCKPGGPSFGLENTNGGLVVFAGGVPLRGRDGGVTGAVGVSGGSPAQDGQVAAAAAAAALSPTRTRDPARATTFAGRGHDEAGGGARARASATSPG